jgi:acyl-CoA synthetase (AMP-forming)/AMP-acid ligase II
MNVSHVNVADRLATIAQQMPGAVAIARASRGGYTTCTFRELDDDATALARGLIELGVTPGMRIVLLVKPGVEFVKLVFALLRSGATTVLLDPGMGRKHLVDCLAAVEPDGFVAISAAQAMRTLLQRRFPRARFNVTVGRRWFWGGATYKQVLKAGSVDRIFLPRTDAKDAAAIIFTSGSTGPPKGVLYTHEMFDTQASEIQWAYDLQPGGADLACFALFGLFNSAMGVTTVFPEMDFSRPASADPRKLLAAANDWKVTQAFASPAVWDKLSRHCEKSGERIPTLRKIFSCGAPVPAAVLTHTLAFAHPEAQMHTPYGATEALPVATIEAREVLGETAAKTNEGAGVCVGRRFDSIEWRIVRISDEPIGAMEDAEELGVGEIGELVVRGAQVSTQYMQTPVWTGRLSDQSEARAIGHSVDANRGAKIRDGDAIWHRMGDVGYLDELGRFWYCGRKSQRVETVNGPLYTECIEAIFNNHELVTRTALVGIGRRRHQEPVIVFEAAQADPMAFEDFEDEKGRPTSREAEIGRIPEAFARMVHERDGLELLRHFLRHKKLPVDVRHNAKINREQLAAWAATRVDPLQTSNPRSLTGG